MFKPAQLIPLRYRLDSADWFLQIRHMPQPIWLDSGHPGSSYGRFDILSAAPAVTLATTDKITHIESIAEPSITSTENPFQLLARYLPAQKTAPAEIPFVGGALGYFAYDLGRHQETLPEIADRDLHLPDMAIGIYPWAIVQDHLYQHAWLVINPIISPSYNFNDIKRLTDFGAAKFSEPNQSLNSLSADIFSTNFFNINKFKSDLEVKDYRQAITNIKDYIGAGDCYQVNFAQRFSSNCVGDPFVAYLKLREVLPSPFSAYMELTKGAVLSLSPERFIKLEGTQAETKPIKGTMPRGATSEEDRANAHKLKISLKDRAENLMIVDLLRNDLSKTCSDVKVPELFNLQSFANVHHLVSTVTGRLKDGMSALDLLATSFPGGSITGAPKIRAMEIIEELEPVRRSVYCGSIGYISACGNMDTNIAIRTLICDAGNIYCWGGGGIVADSESDKEFAESLAKVNVLMDTLERYFINK